MAELTDTKFLKWNDAEYKRNYYKEYYHKNKNLKNKPRVVETENWTKDPDKVKEYLKEYKRTKGNEKEICSVCQVEHTINNRYLHRKTKIHLNALKLLNIQQ